MKWIVEIDENACTGCGECVENCPGDVFEMVGSCSQPVNIDECHGCHTCEEVCEEDAVKVEEGE